MLRVCFLKDTFIAYDCPVKVADKMFGKYVPCKHTPDQANSEAFIKGFREDKEKIRE